MCLALKISATISLNLGLLLGVDALSLPCPQIAATADVVLRTEFTVGEKEICDKTSGVEMKVLPCGFEVRLHTDVTNPYKFFASALYAALQVFADSDPEGFYAI